MLFALPAHFVASAASPVLPLLPIPTGSIHDAAAPTAGVDDLVSAVLDAASDLLGGLADALEPLAGSSASAAAVVLATLAVRALLVPLGVIRTRAELARRRLAPRIRELRRRWSGEQLQRRILDLHRRERISPFAGLWPSLAQLPVVAVVWGVFTQSRIAGHANPLFADALLGVPLGSAPLSAFGTGGWALGLVATLLFVAVAVAALTRRQTVRMLDPGLDDASLRVVRLMSWASFVSVPIAATAPLAAGLYVVVSAAWTLGERALLKHILGGARR